VASWIVDAGVLAFGGVLTKGTEVATKQWRGEFKRRRVTRAFNRGVPAVDGVTREVLPGPNRVEILEDENTRVWSAISQLDAKIEGRFNEVLTRIDNVASAVGLLFKNGEDTDNPGDLYARMARRLGVFLDNGTGKRPVAIDQEDHHG
jgi:hypothetical protein